MPRLLRRYDPGATEIGNRNSAYSSLDRIRDHLPSGERNNIAILRNAKLLNCDQSRNKIADVCEKVISAREEETVVSRELNRSSFIIFQGNYLDRRRDCDNFGDAI